MAKAFGSLATLRDPVSGTYRVLSAAEQSQPTITSSQTAGMGRERMWVEVDHTDEHTRQLMNCWLKEMGFK